ARSRHSRSLLSFPTRRSSDLGDLPRPRHPRLRGRRAHHGAGTRGLPPDHGLDRPRPPGGDRGAHDLPLARGRPAHPGPCLPQPLSRPPVPEAPHRSGSVPLVSAFQSLRGMRDVLPPESGRRRALVQRFAEVAERAGYGEIVPPLLEDLGVFLRVGESTDVVTKEMYDFVDKDGTRIALRPEMTAGV